MKSSLVDPGGNDAPANEYFMNDPDDSGPDEYMLSPEMAQKEPVWENQNICVVQGDMYLYRCSFFRWCGEERRLICQHPHCHTHISGSFLDGSLFQSMKSHVETEHSSRHPSEGLQCGLCSKVLGKVRLFLTHVVRQHTNLTRNKTKDYLKWGCEVCGTSVYKQHYGYHGWTHKNFREKVALIQTGGLVPPQVRKYVEKKKSHPLYSVMFGNGEGVGSKQCGKSGCGKVFDLGDTRTWKAHLRWHRRQKVKEEEEEEWVNSPSGGGSEVEDASSERPDQSWDTPMLDVSTDPIPRDICQSVYPIQENLYLYHCSFFRWCGVERRLLCQHANCRAHISGSFLDGSLFENMKSHVEELHRVNVHSIAEIECGLCSKTFSFRPFRCHLIQEHADASFKYKNCLKLVVCELCGKTFNMGQIGYHAWTHRSFDENLTFLRSGGAVPYKVREHLKTKKGRSDPFYPLVFGPDGVHKRQSCNPTLKKGPVSSLPSSNSASGGNTEKSALPEAPFQCPTCGEVLRDKYKLQRHLFLHLSVEARSNWPCPECNRLFTSSAIRKVHIERVHRPDLKKYRECPVSGCGKKYYFREYTKFQTHMRRHKGETPWICDLCGRGFHSRQNFSGHLKNVHLGEGKCQCDVCGKTYTQRKIMLSHKRTVHQMGEGEDPPQRKARKLK